MQASSHHDVIVVGARCAGAATAMLLARLGYDVALIDRAQFPSDTLSTHGISRGGVVQLQRWGLLDPVLAAGTMPIRQVSFHAGPSAITRQVKDRAGVDHLVAPRRYLLDALVVEAAVSAGAQLYAGTTVTRLLRDPSGRIDGACARRPDGSDMVFTANLVVGADGVRSRLAREFGAPVLTEAASPSGTFYAYFTDLDTGGFEFHVAERALAGVFPSSPIQACVWISAPPSQLSGLRSAGASRTEALVATIEAVAPHLGRRLRDCPASSGVRGAANLPNVIRHPVGPGWALVGDAGYHRDPITGHGMTDAFRDAELLARAVDSWLSGEEPEADALAGYVRRRDEAIAGIFDVTCALTRFPGVDRFVELQKQLSDEIEREAAMLAALPDLISARDLVAA